MTIKIFTLSYFFILKLKYYLKISACNYQYIKKLFDILSFEIFNNELNNSNIVREI